MAFVTVVREGSLTAIRFLNETGQNLEVAMSIMEALRLYGQT